MKTASKHTAPSASSFGLRGDWLRAWLIGRSWLRAWFINRSWMRAWLISGSLPTMVLSHSLIPAQENNTKWRWWYLSRTLNLNVKNIYDAIKLANILVKGVSFSHFYISISNVKKSILKRKETLTQRLSLNQRYDWGLWQICFVCFSNFNDTGAGCCAELIRHNFCTLKMYSP